MNRAGRMRRLARDERGAAIVLIALCMAVMLGMAALAIDIGMVLTARTEAQRAADSGAMAGAGQLIQATDDQDAARAKAIEYAGLNNVLGDGPVVLPEDVEIDLVEGVVRVTVHRTAARGAAVPTWFARVFGVDQVDVRAVAAAGIAQGGGATCLKPWVLMDGFKDNDLDGLWTEGMDEYDGYGYGTEAGSAWRNINDCCYEKDIGRPLTLKPGSPNDAIQPGWFFPWNMPNEDGSPSSGGAEYREDIRTCNPTAIYVDDETQYMVETGNMIGPTKQGVNDLLAMDPGASYDLETNSVVGSAHESSPRIIKIPVYRPTYDLQQGKKPLTFINIMSFFLEDMQGNNVVGRIMQTSGVAAGEGGGVGDGIYFVQLIE